MESSEIRPRSWTSRAIKRQSRLHDFQNFDLYFDHRGRSYGWVGLTKSSKFWPLSWKSRSMSLVPPVLILNLEDNWMASSGLDDLQCLVLDLEYRGRWAWFHPFDLSGLSRCFIWTSIISSGAVVTTGWLEVVTSSQISSSRQFRLARMRVINCLVQLSWIRAYSANALSSQFPIQSAHYAIIPNHWFVQSAIMNWC